MQATHSLTDPDDHRDATYYVVDYSKCGVREVLHLARGKPPAAMIAVVLTLAARLFGKSCRKGPPFRRVDSEFIYPNRIPAEVQRLQQPAYGILATAGYSPLLATRKRDIDPSRGYTYSHVLSSPDATVVATITSVQVKDEDICLEKTAVALSSRRQQGTVIMTTNGATGLRMPDHYSCHFLFRGTVSDVIETHRHRTAGLADLVSLQRDSARAQIETRWQEIAQFHIDRGVYVPATADEVAKLYSPSI
jgi:hypothetical protein